jgi:hypothetical protein
MQQISEAGGEGDLDITPHKNDEQTILVAAWVSGLSLTEIAGPNPAGGMVVCLL